MFHQVLQGLHRRQLNQQFTLLFVGLVLVSMVANTGCVSLFANIMHIIHGRDVPAPFDKLEGKRVAVVVNSESGMNDMPVVILGRNIREIMGSKVKDIELVPQSQVERWANEQDWEDVDYEAIGKGVKADYVVAVELIGLQLKDGDTLYRGRCDCYTTVYEVGKGSKPAYRAPPMQNYSFPSNGGQPVTGTDENSFRRIFLGVIAKRVARNFHPYNPDEDIAADAEAAIF
ncbi:MAG: hypothetical protein JNK90_17905 [Planctomycetaceae bacterium]|nr:hypothetical protein [Planctomycetaceae bacterium]MBN8604476.1 hypothetical protein [Planctomycetota bacterium]